MYKLTVRDYGFREMPDDDADWSWLEQDGFEERLEALRNGEFWFVVVQAYVELECQTTGDEAPPAIAGRGWTERPTWLDLENPDARFWTLEYTASLGGIESDYTTDYGRIVQAELLAEVLAELELDGLMGPGVVETLPVVAPAAA